MNRPSRAILKGFVDMLPLCLAVIPWGILCGSLAIQNGFTALETQAMSLLVFAGSAQLVAIELIAGNTPLLTILFTTFIISSRHFLYGLAVRHKVIDQPLSWRLPVSFVLTDELFAFSHHPKAYRTKIRLIYALSAGFSFYIAWNLWTFIGIVAGTMLPDLTHLGLDFAIAATFIALVIPGVKSLASLVTVIVAGISATLFKSTGFELWLVSSALLAMSAGYFTARITAKKERNL
ncbi:MULTISPECIES: AzlC family ABC transporter permease [Pseudoalteromonas]|nr:MULTISPECIES: AzlC family ABC transporter permease [Pseudoalteromonas]MBB1406557.1 AzlC family ABC transporter permease [Pseudoalteromonas sp. SG44-5]MBE0419152.1 AzlC family ABC transporter permease [Pseudoalteromonas nigrifaciens]MBH0093944.1 AzlC family ABC transporter permease [Pseudoalteromonas sp. SCQQ13]MBO7926487.1 AzlC family ABC transporter permease [Pseudoalteromonas sp. K222D]SUC50584.1 Inner membrane protein YgaZ [Pseudoalteromonas nigrifaciens]